MRPLHPLLAAMLLTGMAAVALGLAKSAHAGYALPSAPTGFGGASGAWTFNGAAASNSASYSGGKIATSLRVAIPGQAVTMPAAMRFAANAGQVAAAAVRLNPALAAASVVAAFLLPISWDAGQNRWEVPGSGDPSWTCNSGNYACSADGAKQYLQTEAGYTPSSFNLVHTNTVFNSSAGTISFHFNAYRPWNGEYWSSPIVTWGGAVSQPNAPTEATQADWDSVGAKPIPDNLPAALPVPLPVEQPLLNPSADPVPVPVPLRVPVGEPVAVPGSDPAKWRQPVIDIVPAPTTDQPWRVDLQPKDIELDSPGDKLSGPVSVGSGDPAAIPKEEQQQLCEAFPDIVACMEPGDPVDVEMPEEERSVSISPEGGFGADTASCPPPQQLVTALAGTIELSWGPVCDFATALRPIVIAAATLSAALIFLGGFKGED